MWQTLLKQRLSCMSRYVCSKRNAVSHLYYTARRQAERIFICPDSRFKCDLLKSNFLNLLTNSHYEVPLFWTQTGYGLKPPPTLATDRTHDQNFDALKRHFMRTIPV